MERRKFIAERTIEFLSTTLGANLNPIEWAFISSETTSSANNYHSTTAILADLDGLEILQPINLDKLNFPILERLPGPKIRKGDLGKS